MKKLLALLTLVSGIAWSQVQIQQQVCVKCLPQVNQVTGLDLTIDDQGGITKSATMDQILAFIEANYAGGGSSGGSSFSGITTGANTTATMTVGSGASIAVSGSGTVEATALAANSVATGPFYVGGGPLNATNQFLYGWGNSAVGVSEVANSDHVAQVMGTFGTPSVMSGYSERDMVGMYFDATSSPLVANVTGTFTSTTFVPGTALSAPTVANLRVGMIIDTNDSPNKFSGIITSWAGNGSSITVSNWYQHNGGVGTPAGTMAYINPVTRVFGGNGVAIVQPGTYPEGIAATGLEVDVQNYVGPGTSDWGYLCANTLNIYPGGVCYNTDGKWTYGFESNTSGTAGFFVPTSATLAAGFLDSSSSGSAFETNGNPGASFNASAQTSGIAFQALGVMSSGFYIGTYMFKVASTGQTDIGSESAPSSSPLVFHSSGNAGGDASIIATGGTGFSDGTLSLNAHEVNINGTFTIGNTGTQIFYPISPVTTATIDAAAAAASAAGGGIVQLPNQSITITAPLPLYSNVIYQGAGYQMPINSFLRSPLGTVLTCSANTFDAFDYFGYAPTSTTPGVANSQNFPTLGDVSTTPSSSTTFFTAKLNGAGIQNLSITGCYNGIKIGGQYNPGASGLIIQNVGAFSNAGWGIWLENYQQSIGYNLFLGNNTLGQLALGSSGGTVDDGGNSDFGFINITSASTNPAQRGLLQFARGSSGSNSLNQSSIHNVTMSMDNRLALVSSGATMSSSSQNITVSNASSYIVDMPVVMSGTLTNTPFATLTTYYVAAVGSGYIQVTNFPGNVPMAAATGSATFTVTSYAFAPLDLVGYYYSGGHNTLFPMEYRDLDLEVPTGVANSMVNMSSVRGARIGLNYVNAGSTATVVQRISDAVVIDGAAITSITYDIDNNFSNPTIHAPRYKLGQTANFTGDIGIGCSSLAHNATQANAPRTQLGSLACYIGGNYTADLYYNYVGGFNEWTNVPLGMPSVQLANNATINPTAANTTATSNLECPSSGNNTLTLPTIATYGDGLLLFIWNPSTGTCTLDTNGTQTFNNSTGTVSYTIAANSGVVVQGENAAGTLYYGITGGGTGGGSGAFSGITSGTNVAAAMLVGSGASLGVTGSGTIQATSLTALTGMPSQSAFTLVANPTNAGAVPIATSVGGNLSFNSSNVLVTSQAIDPNNSGACINTTYTVAASDAGALLTFCSSTALTVTLPVHSTTGFGVQYSFDAYNYGAGTATITPTTDTINNGGSTVAMAANTGCTFTLNAAGNWDISACTATSPSGSGSGTVNSGTSGQVAYYATTGTAVSGETVVTTTQGGTGVSAPTIHEVPVAEGASAMNFIAGCASGVLYWSNSSTDPTCTSQPITSYGRFTTAIELGSTTHILVSATAPTISSGFCSSPSVSVSNGTAAFIVAVGSSCSAGTGVITMPAVSTGWICQANDLTSYSTLTVAESADTTNSVTVAAFSRTTGIAANFNSSDVLQFTCMAY